MTTTGKIPECETLDELLDALLEMDDSQEVDKERLPTFGGAAPTDRNGVLSWDKTHLLIEADGTYDIVSR